MLNCADGDSFLQNGAEGSVAIEQGILDPGKIEELAADPLSQGPNVTRLRGRPEYRMRVQDWRVIFRLEENVLWIEDIGPRSSIYRG
jgi:mRNA interferase RelE/StbE